MFQGDDVVNLNSDIADYKNLAIAALTFFGSMGVPIPIRRNNDEASIVTEAKLVNTLITILKNNRKNLKKISGNSRRRIVNL